MINNIVFQLYCYYNEVVFLFKTGLPVRRGIYTSRVPDPSADDDDNDSAAMLRRRTCVTRVYIYQKTILFPSSFFLPLSIGPHIFGRPENVYYIYIIIDLDFQSDGQNDGRRFPFFRYYPAAVCAYVLCVFIILHDYTASADRSTTCATIVH